MCSHVRDVLIVLLTSAHTECIASYGAPPTTYTPPPYTGSSSSSTNHTVIVGPGAGVLRFVPPFINASIGDTVHFVWMTSNHTVTKSSELFPCNKTEDQPFASGEQNSGFTFDQTVNDTNPTFFYCGTPTHWYVPLSSVLRETFIDFVLACNSEKGMWGAINPPMSVGSESSVNSMMSSMVSNDSSLSAMWAYMNSINQQYNASSQAMNWGMNYNVSAIPSWAQSDMMANIMYVLRASPSFLSTSFLRRSLLVSLGTLVLSSP